MANTGITSVEGIREALAATEWIDKERGVSSAMRDCVGLERYTGAVAAGIVRSRFNAGDAKDTEARVRSERKFAGEVSAEDAMECVDDAQLWAMMEFEGIREENPSWSNKEVAKCAVKRPAYRAGTERVVPLREEYSTSKVFGRPDRLSDDWEGAYFCDYDDCIDGQKLRQLEEEERVEGIVSGLDTETLRRTARLLARGYSDEGICHETGKSLRTIQLHRKKIASKAIYAVICLALREASIDPGVKDGGGEYYRTARESLRAALVMGRGRNTR